METALSVVVTAQRDVGSCTGVQLRRNIALRCPISPSQRLMSNTPLQSAWALGREVRFSPGLEPSLEAARKDLPTAAATAYCPLNVINFLTWIR